MITATIIIIIKNYFKIKITAAEKCYGARCKSAAVAIIYLL